MKTKLTYQELENKNKELESKLKELESCQMNFDVIEFKKLKDSEKRSRAWIENSPVCTKIVDTDFNLQYMSESGINELKIKDITEYYGKPYPLHFYPDSFKIPMNNNLKKVKKQV